MIRDKGDKGEKVIDYHNIVYTIYKTECCSLPFFLCQTIFNNVIII